MSKHKVKRTPESKTNAKAIVMRLAGDCSPGSYPRSGDSAACALCGMTPFEVRTDALGNLRTEPPETTSAHRPDCAWRLACEHVAAHPKLRRLVHNY